MTTQLLTTIYTAAATGTGGREGHVRTDDGMLDVDLARPTEMGGSGGATNPEQLFAAGYAACLLSALAVVAHRLRIDASEATVTVNVSLGPIGSGRYGLAVAITGSVPGVDEPTARRLLHGAHDVCPYSNAVRGNIDVTVELAPDGQ